MTIEKLCDPVSTRYTRKQMRFIRKRAKRYRGSIPQALRKLVDEAEAVEKYNRKSRGQTGAK